MAASVVGSRGGAVEDDNAKENDESGRSASTAAPSVYFQGCCDSRSCDASADRDEGCGRLQLDVSVAKVGW